MESISRLRALLGLSLASAIAWIPLGTLVSIGEALLNGRPVPWAGLVANVPLVAVVGGVCGFVSGLVVSVAESRRSVGSLSYARMATWGALGALAVPGGYLAFNGVGLSVGEIVEPLAVFGALGAATSCAVLAIAKRAPDPVGAHSPARRPVGQE